MWDILLGYLGILLVCPSFQFAKKISLKDTHPAEKMSHRDAKFFASWGVVLMLLQITTEL